jgi:hypothetical protein
MNEVQVILDFYINSDILIPDLDLKCWHVSQFKNNEKWKIVLFAWGKTSFCEMHLSQKSISYFWVFLGVFEKLVDSSVGILCFIYGFKVHFSLSVVLLVFLLYLWT